MYKIQEITNKQTWETFITKESGKTSCPTSFIQSWDWGGFLQKMGEKIYRLGVFEGEKLVGIMLGAKIDAKRGRYIHFRHGPVIDWSNEGLVEFVFDELKKLAKAEDVWFIRFSPLISKFDVRVSGLVSSQMHNVDAEQTWVLDLDKSEEELLANMRKNTRYSIRKAEREGVKIIKTRDPKYLKDFWEIMQDTVNRKQWTFYSFDYIKNEFETFLETDSTLLFLAKYQEKFISGAMFNFYNGQSVYRHSGNLTEYLKVPASYLLQWEAIKESKSRGMKKHNFWGLPLTAEGELDMNDPWSGLGLFKVGFGGRPEQWIHAQDLPVSPLYWLTHYFEKFESWKRSVSGKSK